jgi:signal peptidase I
VQQFDNTTFLVNITNAERKNLRLAPGFTVTDFIAPPDNKLFPYYLNNSAGWSQDNYGPVWIPRKGASIPLTPDNIVRYGRCITAYEGHQLNISNGKVLIDGKEATTYTFAMNYYWLMGDNRHNSLDSRYWGFVPEDHVVGKASLIWFSWQGGPRWNRLFKKIR